MEATRKKRKYIPQAGTYAQCNGESRPELFSLGSSTYSGESNVSQPSTQKYNLRPRTSNGRVISKMHIINKKPLSDIASSSKLQSSPLLSQSQSPSSLQSQTHPLKIVVPPQSPSFDNFSLGTLFESSRSSLHSFETSLHNSLTTSTSSSLISNVVAPQTNVDYMAPTSDKHSARKKWTSEMNTFIMRSYFILTNMEKDLTGYLSQLHRLFLDRFPNMNVSKQRVGDQRRAIIRNKLLSLEEIANIKLQAVGERTTNNTESLMTAPRTNTTRRKWSKDINEAIIRTYLEVTEMEKNKTAYRKKLHVKIIGDHPEFAEVSEQRIADQRRIIVLNKLISEDRLQEIKNEVARMIADKQIETSDAINSVHITLNKSAENTENCTEVISHEYENFERNSVNVNDETDYSSLSVSLSRIFKETYERFKHTSPTNRPFIPKQKSSKKFKHIIQCINTEIIPSFIHADQHYNETNLIIYCAAYTAAIANGSNIEDSPPNIVFKNKLPPWQHRLNKRIQMLRKEIGRMTQFMMGNRNSKVTSSVNSIREKYKNHATHDDNNFTDLQFLDTLKQKLCVTASRLKRYTNCTLRKKQNSQFNNSEKQFYRQLKTSHMVTPINNSLTLNPQKTYEYWNNIWANPVIHNDTAPWIETEINTCFGIPPMEFKHIPVDVFKIALYRAHNWKAPGSDNIQNFWYKKFTSLHSILYNHINDFVSQPHTMPEFITEGKTYLIPKGKISDKPEQYRPITCLQTMYKLITSCLTEIIYEHISSKNILTEEQKGCCKNSRGCKEQLIIDSVVMKQALNNKKDISTMYIDYQKAFDSIPHTWLLKALNIYKIHPDIIAFLKNAMDHWKTQIKLENSLDQVSFTIPIKRGIFQGDSLSPLWFCLSLNPLSKMLRASPAGFPIRYGTRSIKLSHLLYMDDIKLYSNSTQSLHTLADITQLFSHDINMVFGIDKCKTLTVKRGNIEKNRYKLISGEIIEAMDLNNSYKYLGMQQARQIEQKNIKLDISKEFKIRLNEILKTSLVSKNIIKAINTYVVPVLTYTFGVIKWSRTDLQKFQRIISTSLTQHRKHHPKSCT